MLLKFGETVIIIKDGHTQTIFADGHECSAYHTEQPGQAERAAELGFASAEEMNRGHDLTHSWLAHVLGLKHSPTLYGMATGKTSPVWRQEEAAVLALQAYVKALGKDMLEIARNASAE